MHGVGVSARVTAKDGEGGAGGGAGDARGGVGRRARSRHARPRQAACVERVDVVVAPRACADGAATEDVQRLSLQVRAVATARSGGRAMDGRSLPLGLLLLNLEQADRRREGRMRAAIVFRLRRQKRDTRSGRGCRLGRQKWDTGICRGSFAERAEGLVARVRRQVGDFVTQSLQLQDAWLSHT